MAASSDEILILDSRRRADPTVSKTIKTLQKLGNDQLAEFVHDRLSKKTVSLLAPLSRNKLPLLSYRPLSRKQNIQLKVSELKTDCELFSRLYIACQSRNGDLDEFFKHENQAYPPSLSTRGSLRLGTKSDLVDCLCKTVETPLELEKPHVDALILDGAVIVQILPPGCSRTFRDYAGMIFLPYIRCLFGKTDRIDVVFDVYLPNSLKASTRDKRGTGARTRVTPTTKIPTNWQEFMRVDENKTELFHFLADCLMETNFPNKLLLTTRDDKVLSRPDVNIDLISPCSQEEADTRLVLHCHHAALCGAHIVAIKTVDTDVVVLAVSYF